MSGLNDILNIAKSALLTQQRAMDVTGHNIANAATPGYVRQSINLIEAEPLRTPNGLVGRGVTDDGIFAIRDQLLDASYRSEQGDYNSSNTMQGLLNQLQSLTSQSSDSGLGASLDTFFGAFNDLANDPTSASAKVAVRADAQAVIQQLHQLQDGVNSVQDSAKDDFNSTVTRVNQITTQIAALNKQIVATGGPEHTAPDLENQRGSLLDELSGIVNVRVLQRTDGSVGVLAGDTLLVDGGVAQTINSRTAGPSLAIGIVGDSTNISLTSGKLKGLEDFMGTALPGIQSTLDQFTSGLVTSVNAIQVTGPNGYNFFDPAGTTAGTIALSTQVAASAANIDTGTTNTSGDNSLSLAVAQLRTAGNASLGGQSLGAYLSGIVTDIGSQTQNAGDAATAAQTVATSLDTQRQSETGVSTDEELTTLIKQQQAYAAAAHLVTIANDLMADVLNMVQ